MIRPAAPHTHTPSDGVRGGRPVWTADLQAKLRAQSQATSWSREQAGRGAAGRGSATGGRCGTSDYLLSLLQQPPAGFFF